MRSSRGLRRRHTAALLAVGFLAASCTSGGDEAVAETTTSVATSEAATVDSLTVAFVQWYNAVTSGDAPAPNCGAAAPVWVAADSLKPASSGPLLVCADRTSTDELVLRIVNNASGPLTIDYPDAVAGWMLNGTDDERIAALPGGAGALIRPGGAASLTAGLGTWVEQDLTVSFGERWAIVEATSALMVALELENTFDWATDLADACDVDALADADLGAPLEAGLHDYFGCVFDALGGAVDDADRLELTDIVPLVAELVERSRNLARQQQSGAVRASLAVIAEAPEPAGPSIEETTTTTVATRPPTTRPPTTRVPTTPVPTTAPPTSAPPTSAAPTTITTLHKVTTTQEDPGLTVPLPPAPVLVALETVGAGVDTYTSWPAIDPKLGRLPGGQIVVVECKAFTSATTAGGNGWWYRIGSGSTAGGWASATGFKNLVAGIEPGSTSVDNVNSALSNC